MLSYLRSNLAALILPCFSLACSGPADAPAKAPRPITAFTPQSPPPQPALAGQFVANLGIVLTSGDTIHYTYVLTNRSARPVRLFTAIPATPCCSSVDTLPSYVASGGELQLSTSFVPGLRAGPQQLQFLLRTDDPVTSTYRLVFMCDLRPDLLVEPQDGEATHSVFLGCARTVTINVTYRHGRNETLLPPHAVTASEPLSASITAPEPAPSTVDYVETLQHVNVTIPAPAKLGYHRGLLHFAWMTGQSRDLPFQWRVEPSIRISPSAAIVRAGDQPKPLTVTITSFDGPFRVLNVDHATCDRLPSDKTAASHTLLLKPTFSASQVPGIYDILVTTDHPRQRTVAMTVQLLPPGPLQ